MSVQMQVKLDTAGQPRQGQLKDRRCPRARQSQNNGNERAGEGLTPILLAPGAGERREGAGESARRHAFGRDGWRRRVGA